MSKSFNEASLAGHVPRSQIMKRRKSYKRKIFLRRLLISLVLILILSVMVAGAVLLFYVAIDDGEEFYPEENNAAVESENINVSPTDDTGDFSIWNEKCDFNLIVVNKDNELPTNFRENLVDFRGAKVDKRIADNLSKMMDDAASDSVNLWISSGYRSVKLQAEIMDDEISKNIREGHSREEAEELAKKLVAEPGKSEHHTGLAIDFNGVSDDFYNTDAYKWLIENAQNYGFILRYPESKKDITGINFEPWHFRYVGVSAAKAMHGKDICLEEYIDSIK